MAETTPDQLIHGSCHCGNIGFEFRRPGGDGTIAARVCGCSFCIKHGGVWTSHPQGDFRLRIDDAARATVYRFGTNSADFHVCSTCGVVPIVTCVIDGARYAVANVNAFDDVDRALLVQAPMNFDTEDVETRMARRRRNWTPEAP